MHFYFWYFRYLACLKYHQRVTSTTLLDTWVVLTAIEPNTRSFLDRFYMFLYHVHKDMNRVLTSDDEVYIWYFPPSKDNFPTGSKWIFIGSVDYPKSSQENGPHLSGGVTRQNQLPELQPVGHPSHPEADKFNQQR
jgi:hypothetical protein